VAEGPFSTEPKLRGKAKEGIQYQAKVHDEIAKLPGNLHSEQWIRFKDNGRWYHCRPDDITETHDRVVVVESKLSLRQLKKGLAQLRLYKPILERIYRRPVVCVLAFKHWIIGTEDCLPMLDSIAQTTYTPTAQLRKTHGWNFIS